MITKAERLQASNRVIEFIATHGRKFFGYSTTISRFELDARGRIWFVDWYRGDRIYTHYTKGSWHGFSEGGTLRALVVWLRDYIQDGNTINFHVHFGPWPKWLCGGDPWGYGSDMELVREFSKKVLLSIGEA